MKMKNLFLYSLLISLLAIPLEAFSQCYLPSAHEGNTGVNMTVMFTPDLVSSLNITEENAFLVAYTSNGLVVGSIGIFGISQISMAVWGDDSQTTEVDGALANEFISFQFVNGLEMYDVVMPSPVSYTTNGLVVETSAAAVTFNCSSSYGCTDVNAKNYDSSATDDDGSCEYDQVGGDCNLPLTFEGNTGAVMTLMLLPDFVSSLNITDENAYVVALTVEGLVIGSVGLFGISQTSLAVWGDDSQTTEIDGALANEEVSFQFVNGTDLYDLVMPTAVSYVTNGLSVEASPGTLSLVECESSTIFGCMDSTADNYNAAAIEDDGSCIYTILGCTDTDALNYNSLATADDSSCEYEQTSGVDCILPSLFEGNTGANMTVVLTSDFFNFFPDLESSAYIVALTESELIVGSTWQPALEWSVTTSIAIWGEDTSTPETDGAQANEFISFQLVNGTDLYNVEMPVTVNYTTNGLVVQVDPAILTSVNCGYGCSQDWADNYDELATIDDGSCFKLGCMDSTADNYNTTATEDDGSCTYTILGCTSDWADNYEPLATENDGSCSRLGCTDDWADNYDVLATDNDGSCSKVGCTEDWGDNYDPFATISSTEIPEQFSGNTGVNMTIFLSEPFINSLNITEENVYIMALNTNGLVVGSVNIGVAYLSYGASSLAIWGDDSITPDIDGALANEAISFLLVNGIEVYDVEMPTPVFYATNSMSLQLTSGILTLTSGDDCIRLGCTSDWADNYDALATEDDGSCSKLGCTFDWADNFDSLATEDDDSCSKLGCKDVSDCNFDVLATIDDGSCIGQPGCLDHFYLEYNPLAGCSLENACQTSWIQLYDSLQIAYNDLDISYNIGSQELNNTILTLDSLQVEFNTITTLYIDSISQITINYNSLDAVCTQEMIQSAFAIDSLNYVNESYIDSITQITINYNSLVEESAEDMIQSGLTIDSLNYLSVSLSEEIEYWSSPIVIDLILGWNIIGYTPKEPQDIVVTLQVIDDVILIVKNNAAEVYWPEYGFNGIGNLIPGQGYQIKVSDEYLGFTYPNVNGERIELTPTVPMWAIDMEVEMHPNDIRTLVRVVNMLGQEVNPTTQFNGEVLLYLYNDGTVEKKIVE